MPSPVRADCQSQLHTTEPPEEGRIEADPPSTVAPPSAPASKPTGHRPWTAPGSRGGTSRRRSPCPPGSSTSPTSGFRTSACDCRSRDRTCRRSRRPPPCRRTTAPRPRRSRPPRSRGTHVRTTGGLRPRRPAGPRRRPRHRTGAHRVSDGIGPTRTRIVYSASFTWSRAWISASSTEPGTCMKRKTS